MTVKEKTSLYAGEIYLKMGDILIRPTNVTIKKSLTTITDTFSFTVPMWNDNGDVVQIPNTFGLPIDVYVNDTFYVGGILLRRIVQDNDIYCECSTHGWQLDNSEIINELEANTETLESFIYDTCQKNFQYYFRIYLTEVQDKKLIPELIDGKNFYNISLEKLQNGDNIKSPEICYFINNYKNILKVPTFTKELIEFVIYDPYDLGKIKLSDYIVAEDKKNKVKSEYGQTVFQYIKSVTKNINVFIKCIGIYDQIKDKLATERIRRLPKILTGKTIYVLLLYRPGIDKDIYNSVLKETESYQTGINFSKLELENNKSVDVITIKPNQKIKLYTREYNKTIGNIYNDTSHADSCNCLENPVEEYGAINCYSSYILLDKNKGRFEYNAKELENDPLLLQSLKKQNLVCPFYAYDKHYNLGTYKIIKVEKFLTEHSAKLRLAYEINKIRSESYKVKAKVLGFTMDMNFAKARYSESIGNTFWDFGKTVKIYSPKQNLNSILTIEEIEMHYDSHDGAYTNLTLTYPFAYSGEELEYDEYTQVLAKTEELSMDEKNYFRRVWRGSWYAYKTLSEGILGFFYESQNIFTINKKYRLMRSERVEQRLNKAINDTKSVIKTGYTSDEIKKMIKKND